MKPGGIFITEQVGAENDRELVELLLGSAPELPFPGQYLRIAIKFWDVGALVWFARIIEWEFPDFSVESCLGNLYRAQEILEREGVIEGSILTNPAP